MSNTAAPIRRTRLSPDQLRDEDQIVWLVPVESLPRYVRETLQDYAPFRVRRFRMDYPGRMVGYSTLRPDAPSICGQFHRRVFWLKPYDAGERDAATGPYHRFSTPYEGVDPLTVAPGQPGRVTDRAVGVDPGDGQAEGQR